MGCENGRSVKRLSRSGPKALGEGSGAFERGLRMHSRPWLVAPGVLFRAAIIRRLSSANLHREGEADSARSNHAAGHSFRT